mgnify:CR=1 FL=1
MTGSYLLALDQGTTSSRAILFNQAGEIVSRAQHPFRQIYPQPGWVEHDPLEIWATEKRALAEVVGAAHIDPKRIAALGITNQRETTILWDRSTGQPVCNAIVWQCRRTASLCDTLKADGLGPLVAERTGLLIDAYFSGTKIRWLLDHVPGARERAERGELCAGTVDSWLLSFLTREKVHATDYSNASRTQLFDIIALRWDEKLCRAFGVPVEALPEVRMSDSVFGTTDLDGYLDKPIPICGVLGDSHGALFGQDCRRPGQVKATYGTGSSVMMNIGDEPRFSSGGLVTSLAWGMNGRVEYVFEGNLNYTGAVMTWLRKDVGLIENDAEATELARAANPNDRCYFVPAFSGLGAPYWDSRASGMLTGVSRTTGRAEIAKACLECIAYQITDLTELMRRDAGVELASLRVDGGPTASEYLMQFQSDMARASVEVPNLQELSGMGAAYAAGISAGIYDPDRVYEHVRRRVYAPAMDAERREELYKGWQAAVRQVLTHD